MAILDTNKYKLIYSNSIAKALIGTGGVTETLNDYIEHETIDGLADLVISNDVDISPLYPERDIKTIDWSMVDNEYQINNSNGDALNLVTNLELIELFNTSTELRVQLLRSYIQKINA
jgi:hypothetical protein